MIRRASILILVLLLAACGYGFRGTVSYLPEELKTIAIPYLDTQTNEIGLEESLTQGLVREFNRSKHLRLTDLARADVILEGRIVSVETHAVAFEDVRTAVARRVVVNVDLVLIRTDNKHILWQRKGLSEGEDYDVSSNTTVTETNRQKALSDLSKNLAVKAHDSIFENF